MRTNLRRLDFTILGCLCLLQSALLEARGYAVLLTGEVFSRTAQAVFVPHTPQWRASISRMAPEGQLVQPGDAVVVFDGSDTLRQLELEREKRRAELALTERDLAVLEKELAEAGFAVEQAEVSLQLSTLKAEIPQGLIGGIEYAENQLTHERASRTLADALKQLAVKKQSLQARQERAALDRQKSDLMETWWQGLLDRLSVNATQKGYVMHGIHPWTRKKFLEGDSVRTSFKVAEVADISDLAIRVWVNGVDQPRVEVGAPVTITFDAFPERSLAGRLESIADGSSKRLEWGKAAYFEGVVTFDAGQVPGLLPGMSSLVEFR